MRVTFKRLSSVLAGAALLTMWVSATAQTGQSPWKVPRTPWGDPDLQGIWPGTAMMGVPLERPRQLGDRAVLTEDEFTARVSQALTQASADREEFVPPQPTGRGAGTGPPGHWASAASRSGKPH
jgi:hypothetical protein